MISTRPNCPRVAGSSLRRSWGRRHRLRRRVSFWALEALQRCGSSQSLNSTRPRGLPSAAISKKLYKSRRSVFLPHPSISSSRAAAAHTFCKRSRKWVSYGSVWKELGAPCSVLNRFGLGALGFVSSQHVAPLPLRICSEIEVTHRHSFSSRKTATENGRHQRNESEAEQRERSAKTSRVGGERWSAFRAPWCGTGIRLARARPSRGAQSHLRELQNSLDEIWGWGRKARARAT